VKYCRKRNKTPTNSVSATILFSEMNRIDLVFMIETGLNYKMENESNAISMVMLYFIDNQRTCVIWHSNIQCNMTFLPNLK